MSGAICAICYEDARPICEDLQSISACGHVFHELCLQQWMEYCTGKPTCPLCKQSCSVHGVHRLYFQSADSAKPQGSPSRNLQTAGNDDLKQVETAPALRKLESQLAVVKTALQSRDERLKELNSQVVANLQRAEKAEAEKMVARRELAQCKQNFTKIQEELEGCSNERTILQEKNQSIAKDLAAHKLIADTDLGGEETLRLASLGNGSNKNAIIETLNKALNLRNKSYRELMARCNELGRAESRALKKSEIKSEKHKKAKARVQELEKLLEEKHNASLRGLNRGRLILQDEDLPSAQRPFKQAGAKRINAPRTPPDQPTSASTQSPQGKVPGSMFKLPGFGEDLDVLSRAELSEVLPKIVRERGQMGVEHAQPACSKNVSTSEEIPCSRKRGRSETTVHDQEATREHPLLVPSNTVQASLPRPGPTPRLIENRSSVIPSSSTCKEQSILYSSEVEYEVGTQGCSENSGQVNSSLAPPVNSFGAFAKKASSDRLSTSSSTFIVSGADGRGGRLTVLKPPSLEGIATSASQKMKRPKTSGAVFRGAQGSLQMEHFFGRAKS